MASNAIQGICAALAVFAMAYTLYYVFPLFAYAALVVAGMYAYAWLNRKVDR